MAPPRNATGVADVAGSLGQGQLVVLPPAFGGGEGIEVAIGLARWWTRQLRQAGRESVWLMMGVPGSANPRQLQVFDAWPERQVAEAMVAGLHARFGLAPEFTPRGTRTKVDVRLFEVTPAGTIQAIDAWAFDGENVGVPAFAFEVVAGASRCLGARPAAVSWQDAFGTADEVAVMYYLSALGAISLLEERFTTSAEIAVRAVMATYETAPAMQPSIDLMGELLLGMVAGVGASEIEIAGVLRRARKVLGRSPPEWDAILERVRQRAAPGDGRR
jgi:hypothetical protein